jgi:hypothetical protein
VVFVFVLLLLLVFVDVAVDVAVLVAVVFILVVVSCANKTGDSTKSNKIIIGRFIAHLNVFLPT